MSNPCQCMRRTNLTPHVDFIALVVMMVGFKILDDRIMFALIAIFLIQHTIIRIAESKEGPKS